MWLDIVQQFPNAKTYIVCDNLQLQSFIIHQINAKGGGYDVEFISSARDSEELKYIIDNAIVPHWKPAAYAHLTTFLHARDNGYKNFWNIDADDTGLYAKPRKIAKILKNVEIYSVQQSIHMLSLDYWITNSFGENWSFGVSYIDNSINWIELLKKHCLDISHEKHYKRLGIPNNADEFMNYLRKVDDVRIETFYVENLHMIHHHNNVYANPLFGLRHWSNGRCYWHILSETFGMGEKGSLPIPKCMIKFDIGLTIDESQKKLKNSCADALDDLFVKNVEQNNHIVNETVTVILSISDKLQYVSLCLQNFLVQNFKNWSLIVTDAGLNEAALNTCREFESKFEGRMKIITGLSKSDLLSAGLNASKGRYVMFINGNDTFLPNAFQNLHAIAENIRADIVHMSNYLAPNSDNTFSIKTNEPGWGEDIKTIQLIPRPMDKVIAWTEGRISPSIYNNFIRREFLEEEKISPAFNTKISEWLFSLQCLFLAETYVRLPSPLYVKIVEDDTRKVDFKDFDITVKSISEGIKILDKLDNEVFFLEEYKQAKIFLNDVYKNLIRQYLNEVLI